MDSPKSRFGSGEATVVIQAEQGGSEKQKEQLGEAAGAAIQCAV